MMKHTWNFAILLVAFAVSSCANDVNKDDEAKYQTCSYNNQTYLCLNSELCCAGKCIAHDNNNCGSCGARCSQFEECSLQNQSTADITQTYIYACACNGKPCSGVCCKNTNSNPCSDPNSDSAECKDLSSNSNNDFICVDLSSNSEHCNACGNECGKNQACVKSVCVSNCPSTTAACIDNAGNVTCAATATDPNNCGKCGNVCPDENDPNLHLQNSFCSNKCIIVCKDGYENNDNDISNGCESRAKSCGNGVLDPGELCDGNLFGNKTCKEIVGVGSTGTPKCNSTCDGIVEGSCTAVNIDKSKCGNNTIDSGELCDGTQFPDGRKTCAEYFNVSSATGTLKCNSCSQIDASGCIFCGDGKVNGSENCDGNLFKGGKTKCSDVDPKYASGEVKCNTSKCTYNFDDCESGCTENTIKCSNIAPQEVQICKNGKFLTQEKCPADKPVCDVETDPANPKCVECLKPADCNGEKMSCNNHQCISSECAGAGGSTDFEWLNEYSNLSQTEQERYDKKYEKTISNYSLVATCRIFALENATYDDKTAILKGDVSKIEVTGITGGVCEVSFNYSALDKAKLVVSAGTESKEVGYNAGQKGLFTHKFSSKADSFKIESKSAGGKSRIGIDNLKWTTQK